MASSGLFYRFSQVAVLALFAALSGCSGNTDAIVDPDAGVVDRTPPDPQSPPPAASPSSDPAVQLDASDDVVGSGESVQLSWSAANVDECTASGGWSGARGTQGSTVVGPISEHTTFSLTCSGPAGNAVAMLSVSVLGVVSLSWQPPTENVDGTPLTDLTGYHIHFGPDSRNYTDEVPVSGAGTTDQDLVLASGSYYIAMTALDADGNESGYSNEVVKVVN